MTGRTLGLNEARLALAAVHGFIPGERPRGKAGALSVFARHRCVQSDPIDVAGRNHDLTVQSRVDGYRRRYLDELLYEDHELFEYYCKMASVMPLELYPVFNEARLKFSKRYAPFFKEHAKELRHILKELEGGPVCSRDFESDKKVDYWGKTQVYRVLLERLFIGGKVVIHHRETGVKYYSLVEDIVPGHLLAERGPRGAAFKRAVALTICKASRLASPSRAPEQWWEVGKTREVEAILQGLERDGELFQLSVDSWKGSLYAPSEDEGLWADPPEVEGWCRFLAPLDPLLWNRRLFANIYGHEYSWEVYKQEKDRKFGYYCLPVMYNGDYVALIEPWLDKKTGRLEIRSFHLLDRKVDKRRLKRALEDELDRFAMYIGAEKLLAGKVRL
jgi:uncharacterized protein YcaQ